MSYNNLDSAITAYIDYIVADYERFNKAMKDSDSERVANRVKSFRDSVEVRKGKKYIKILSERSVTAFIVAGDDAKFKVGDLLKPASFATPAKNSARGNVLEGKFSGGWTGPAYLK